MAIFTIMEIAFNLIKQSSDPNAESIIYMWVFDSRFDNRKCKYSTRRTFNSKLWAKLWDADKKELKIRSGLSQTDKEKINLINQNLRKLKRDTEDFFLKHDSAVKIDKGAFRNYLEREKTKQKFELAKAEQNIDDFFKIWQTIIDTTKSKNGEDISEGTKRSKKQTLNLVSEYAVEKGIKLSFKSIDMNFYHDLNAFMKGKGLNPNSIGKHFKEIKAVLREAFDRDLEVNMAFQKKSFKVTRSQPDNAYLSYEEIIKLIDAKNLTPGEERQRDIFVMACFVGARHSDWSQIKQSNIVSEGKKELLKYKQTKTKDVIHVPVHPIVKHILRKYHGDPPRAISNQKFNEALKDICKKAELGNHVFGKETVEKWTLISTHTARRSFATNAYLSKAMDVYQIMQCTGHKSESSFLRYLKLDGKDYAMQASDSKFFNDDTLVKHMTKLKIA